MKKEDGWVDMDMTCLKPLNLKEEYVFRTHDLVPVVCNLMKAPKGSQCMFECYLKTKEQLNADNRVWLKASDILTKPNN